MTDFKDRIMMFVMFLFCFKFGRLTGLSTLMELLPSVL